MEIGVISDIHSNYAALEAVLSELDDRNVSEILSAGDFVGYGARPNKIIEELAGRQIRAVRGNHDEAVLTGIPQNYRDTAQFTLDWTKQNLTEESKKFLRQLPILRVEKYGSLTVQIVHGTPKNPLSEYLYLETVDKEFLDENFVNIPDILVVGHTHEPFVKETKRITVLNPGSVGQPRDGKNTASYAVIDTDLPAATRYRVEYDVEKAAKNIQESGLPTDLAERLRNGR